MSWYLTITSEMREAGLTGNGLLVYALVFGYSQSQQGCYYGSLVNTAEVVGCSPETARTALKSLAADGFIERFEFMENGIRRVAYRTTPKIWDTQKFRQDHPKNLGTTTPKIWDNNKGYNKSDNKEGVYSHAHARFVPPTLEDVRAYCFSRGNLIDPQSFIDYYTANGWRVGKVQMRDWRAAVRNWESRRKADTLTPQAPRPARNLSPEERTIAALRRLQERDGFTDTFNPDEQ